MTSSEIQGRQAMKLSKLLRGSHSPLTAAVFCVAVFLGPYASPLLADGTVAPRAGGVSASKLDALAALPSPNPVTISNLQAANKFPNKIIFRRAEMVVQACKPSGAACSLPGECCSNSCVPPGFGGEPTCR